MYSLRSRLAAAVHFSLIRSPPLFYNFVKICLCVFSRPRALRPHFSVNKEPQNLAKRLPILKPYTWYIYKAWPLLTYMSVTFILSSKPSLSPVITAFCPLFPVGHYWPTLIYLIVLHVGHYRPTLVGHY